MVSISLRYVQEFVDIFGKSVWCMIFLLLRWQIRVKILMSSASGWAHDDVIKWKHFPRYWPFLRGIHRPREFPTVQKMTKLRVAWKHDDVIKWKHFPRYWPFVWGKHRSPVPLLIHLKQEIILTSLSNWQYGTQLAYPIALNEEIWFNIKYDLTIGLDSYFNIKLISYFQIM